MRYFFDEHEEHRHQQHADNRRHRHTTEYRYTHDLTTLSSRAGRDDKRNHAEDERERGHQDRPESQLRRLERTLDKRSAARDLRSRELNDQDRILRRESHKSENTDLREDVVHVGRIELPTEPHTEQRSEHRERGSKKYAERQRPALILRREDQEYEHHAEHEHERPLAGRLLLLVRHRVPIVGDILRQRLSGNLLKGGHRLCGAVSWAGRSDHLRRAEEIKTIGVLRPVRWGEVDEGSKGYHVSVLVSHEVGTDILSFISVIRVRLEVYLVETSEPVEVVHVASPQIGTEG